MMNRSMQMWILVIDLLLSAWALLVVFHIFGKEKDLKIPQWSYSGMLRSNYVVLEFKYGLFPLKFMLQFSCHCDRVGRENI